MLNIIYLTGKVSIKENAKKPEVIRQAKNIGLIAGGTGRSNQLLWGVVGKCALAVREDQY